MQKATLTIMRRGRAQNKNQQEPKQKSHGNGRQPDGRISGGDIPPTGRHLIDQQGPGQGQGRDRGKTEGRGRRDDWLRNARS